jgi:3',5'-nucleoside bisphosphate phosphatase
VIDLHMHTTASDGRCSPDDLVGRVERAGIRTFAITDHDTLAALPAARAALPPGLVLVPGIEITAVAGGRDVHVLGYWVDESDADLQAFLGDQRQRRVERVERIAHELAAAGVPIDVRRLLDEALSRPGAAVGRPALARALVAAGHVPAESDAFDMWLGEGRPAYVPRSGVSPGEVIARIHAAGGLASLAHPAVTRRDDQVPAWAAAGLDALEAFHSDHTDADTARYLDAAATLGLAVTGGSDFHGDEIHPRGRDRHLGGVTLPVDRWEALEQARVDVGHAR